ncbi:phosphodiester glycosidase family protein [Trichothermofontia sp.]
MNVFHWQGFAALGRSRSILTGKLLRFINQHGTLSPFLLLLLGITLMQLGKMLPVRAGKQPPPPMILSQGRPLLQQQGNRIALNGRILIANWGQWRLPQGGEARLGISDAGLMQLLGVDLLDTNDPSQQPVQWFSDPRATPHLLPIFLTPQYRYLDITDLLQANQWSVRITGNTLEIQTPIAQLQTLRQGRQAWGQRIVLDLDQATPWQVDQFPQEAIVTLDAIAPPALLQQFRPQPAIPPAVPPTVPPPSPPPLLLPIVEGAPQQTRIRIPLPEGSRVQASTLPNPPRLILDVRNDAPLLPRNLQWAPGLRWQQKLIRLGTAAFPIIWLTVEPDSAIQMRPIWTSPQTLVGIDPLLRMAERNQALAAINGGFFNRNNQLPLGAIRHQGRWLSGPILNRGAIAWNDRGEAIFDRLTLQETLVTGTGSRLPLQVFNSGYVRAGISRYTPTWGSSYTPLTDNEAILIVRQSEIVDQKPGGPQGQTAFPIPRDGFLLVVRSQQSILPSLPVGSRVQIEQATVPANFDAYPHILGAGPLLLQNRQIVLDAKGEGFSDAFIQQLAPRSVICRTATGTLQIAAIHARVGGRGPSLLETAQLMAPLGCVDALNLDGGSSTSLYLGGQLIDRPPRTAARVHNGLGLFLPAPP